MNISLSSPDITQAEIDLINQVLHTPYLSMGPMIERFEAAFADFIGTKHAVAVSSGTAGLHLALIAAEARQGDLVFTTPFSFVASANCILYVGATPVFVDIDPHTLNMNPQTLAEVLETLSHHSLNCRPPVPLISRQPSVVTNRLSAILPVHVFGQACEMESLMELAAQYELTLIEDACEALGTDYNHRRVGSFGDCAVFAFYPNKQMTTGEGGIITTDRDEWAQLFRSLRNQGRDGSGTWLSHIRLGYNYRMDELSAALGVAQLGRIEELLAKRTKVAEWYNQQLSSVDGVTLPAVAPATTRMGWFVYVIRLAPELDRDRVIAELAGRGIPCRPYFPSIHLQPFYRDRFGYQEGDFPVTERVAHSTLALPFHGGLTEDEVAYVCQLLGEVIGDQR